MVGVRVAGSKRVRMTAPERREQLVGVARSLFAERGYEATSIEEIADRAGVSKPVVYQHFGGKEGVYAVVVDREVTYLTASLAGAFDASHPRLVAEWAAEAFLTYIEEREEGFRVLVRDAPIGMTGGSFASVIADVANRAEQLLVQEFSDRGFDADTAPVYALMLVGAVALVGEWWLDNRTQPRDQVAAHVVNLLWNGLRGLDRRPVDRHAGDHHQVGGRSVEQPVVEDPVVEDPVEQPVDGQPVDEPPVDGQPVDRAPSAPDPQEPS
jgi:AcrR family transcriptional regulator